MSNYDPKTRGPDYRTPGVRSNGSWIAGAVIVVVLIVALGYVFSNRMTDTATTEHRAAVEDQTPAAPVRPLAPPSAAPTTPAAPAPAATPGSTNP